jgi:hypothetical protein
VKKNRSNSLSGFSAGAKVIKNGVFELEIATEYQNQAFFYIKNKKTGEKNLVGFELRYYNS